MITVKKPKLITLRQCKRLKPKAQGYVVYMQAALPGSQLHGHEENPYPPGTKKHNEWNDGQLIAVLEVQDLDEG